MNVTVLGGLWKICFPSAVESWICYWWSSSTVIIINGTLWDWDQRWSPNVYALILGHSNTFNCQTLECFEWLVHARMSTSALDNVKQRKHSVTSVSKMGNLRVGCQSGLNGGPRKTFNQESRFCIAEKVTRRHFWKLDVSRDYSRFTNPVHGA